MRKLYFSLLVLCIFAATVFAQEPPQITIVNNTGYEITHVSISTSDDEFSEVNRLAAGQSLRRGHSVILNLPYPINEVNRYNIRLTDSGGDTYTKFNIRITNNNQRISFTLDDWDEVD